MLEAKAKDQGHSRKCFPQKKGLQNFFSGTLQFIGVARIFDWEGLNQKSHAMTSSKFACWHLTRILQMERASTNIVEKCKYVTLETF